MNYRQLFYKINVLWLFLYFLTSASECDNSKIYIPDALQPWKQWVLDKHPKLSCPRIFNDSSQVQCVWQSKLNLQISERSAEFTISVKVFADDIVELPGDSVFWPYDVMANGKAAAVTQRNGIPSIELTDGLWKITGSLNWENRPNSIRIPGSTALVNVLYENKLVTNLSLDKDGMLWFKGFTDTIDPDSVTTDNINVKVYRKVVDAVPLYMVTILKLEVSGKDREMHLGRFLPRNSIPVYLHSPLPATIENDGNIRVQVKSGTWIIEMKSRFSNNINSFKMERKTREWPAQEIWSFVADHRLRTVSIRGVAAIDPGQTGIPQEWSQLQTYLVGNEEYFEIIQEHRGDFSPDPNALNLERKVWLDFKGKTFTIKDHITGNASRSGRLSMENSYTLGSVSLSGVPQLVTTVDKTSPGIEYRQGTIDLECLSTVAKNRMITPGWNHDFSSVNTELHIPPGWSLLHLSGADFVRNSWISKWTVWDLFLLLILVITVAKLFSVKWGVLAAIVFAITFHESGAPLFLWLNLLAAIALVRVMPESKVKKILAFYTMLSFVAICCISITFAVFQLRQALYPQLKRGGEQVGQFNNGSMDYFDKYEDVNGQPAVLSSKAQVQERVAKFSYAGRENTMSQNLDIYDASAKIQTGPGEPSWSWNLITFGWSGPVEINQKIRLYLLPPAANSILSILRVIGLLCLLFWLAKGIFMRKTAKTVKSSMAAKSGSLFSIFFIAMILPANLQAEIPTDELLNELENRLTKNNTCGSESVSIQKGIIKADNETATIELYVDVTGNVACQLPGNRHSWFADKITLNGEDNIAALMGTENGGIAAVIPSGHNKVVMSGKISASRNEIQFPVAVHNISAVSDKWTISGIVGGKVPGGVVKFEKIDKKVIPAASQNSSMLSDRVLPFVEVSRKINIDKEWTVKTVVRRIAPESDPISLRIPLIQNESVISSAISDPIGYITVYMTRDQSEFSWNSTLKMTSEIILEVPQQDNWVEIWSLDQSPRWHVETSGIIQIKQDADVNISQQVWYPLPGEKVILKIQSPEPVAGSTMTIQNVKVHCNPGRKKSNNSLVMTVLSSQADRLQIRLQSESLLDGVSVDGVSQIVSLNNDKLSIQIHPGKQRIVVNWKTKNDLRFITRTPFIESGTGSTNMEIECDIPQDRWLLFTGGPVVGPALLFWPMLALLLLISIGLGKIGSLPLRWYHWFLLSAGMSTVDNVGGVAVVLWFLLFNARKKISIENRSFNRWQICCILLTIAAAGSIVVTIPLGLLNTPDMQISGNYSTGYLLKWFEDISLNVLPQGWFISIPVWIYRMLMLIWSLWAALCLTKWAVWGWNAFSTNGLWKKSTGKIITKK